MTVVIVTGYEGSGGAVLGESAIEFVEEIRGVFVWSIGR